MDAPSNPNPPAPNGLNDPLIVDAEPLPKKTRVNENQSTRESSNVWEHFVKKQYNATRRNRTSSMRAHILKCKKIPGVIDTNQTTLSFQAKQTGGVEGEFSNELVVAKFSIERIRMALVRMIIVDELPFRFVEHDGFIYFMGVVEPRFPVPSRLTIQGIVLNFG